MITPQKDIADKYDIQQLVINFYKKATVDPLLKATFDIFITPTQWPDHVERITAFWSMVIFKNNDYSGNVFRRHINMNLTVIQLDRWLAIFLETVDEMYAGTNADEAKNKAVAMAQMFQAKIQNPDWLNLV